MPSKSATQPALMPCKTVDELSPAQLKVIKLIAKGKINREIGALLGISVETVKEHVANLLRRIGVDNRTKLAVWYIKQQQEVAVG